MGFLSKLFNTDSDEFREVRVDREVLESVIYYAKKAYPNEFLAFFDGKIKDKILYITSLIFLPGENTGDQFIHIRDQVHSLPVQI